jgi:glycerol-3-phosphate acyltransferase PlsY
LKGVDLRTIGSKSIGATNAMRALGKPLGVLAFLLDCGKGFVPVFFVAPWLDAEGGTAFDWLRVLCGAAAVCGHVWPIYLRFRGGKAVATGCGAIVAIDPWIFVIAGLAWLATLALTRYVGLASMVMGVAWPIVALVRAPDQDYGGEVAIATGVLALLILWRHRANIGRMLAGTEPKAGKRTGVDSSRS